MKQHPWLYLMGEQGALTQRQAHPSSPILHTKMAHSEPTCSVKVAVRKVHCNAACSAGGLQWTGQNASMVEEQPPYAQNTTL